LNTVIWAIQTAFGSRPDNSDWVFWNNTFEIFLIHAVYIWCVDLCILFVACYTGTDSELTNFFLFVVVVFLTSCWSKFVFCFEFLFLFGLFSVILCVFTIFYCFWGLYHRGVKQFGNPVEFIGFSKNQQLEYFSSFSFFCYNDNFEAIFLACSYFALFYIFHVLISLLQMFKYLILLSFFLYHLQKFFSLIFFYIKNTF